MPSAEREFSGEQIPPTQAVVKGAHSSIVIDLICPNNNSPANYAAPDGLS
jgi:hypothetical protein